MSYITLNMKEQVSNMGCTQGYLPVETRRVDEIGRCKSTKPIPKEVKGGGQAEAVSSESSIGIFAA